MENGHAMEERGRLIEEREQLKLLLAQEEFYCSYLPQRRQMAIMAIVMDVLTTILFFRLIYSIGANTIPYFFEVLGPIYFIFWAIWVLATWKRIGPNINLLREKGLNREIIMSQYRQRKMQKQIDELQERIDEFPDVRWMP